MNKTNNIEPINKIIKIIILLKPLAKILNDFKKEFHHPYQQMAR